MFVYVAEKELSGRGLRRWLQKVGFQSRTEKDLSLSRIYETLKNPFYYGSLKFDEHLYKDTHEPLITKKIFVACKQHLNSGINDSTLSIKFVNVDPVAVMSLQK